MLLVLTNVNPMISYNFLELIKIFMKLYVNVVILYDVNTYYLTFCRLLTFKRTVLYEFLQNLKTSIFFLKTVSTKLLKNNYFFFNFK